MRLTVESFTLQSARLRRVLDYIDSHLDDEVTLTRLGDLANLSVSQLERLYAKKIGETPMVTVRRLRLKRAYEQIRSGGFSLGDVASAASYGSQAAFTHAFVKQFGYAPSRLPSFAPAVEAPPSLRLEMLPAREVFSLNYSGRRSDTFGGVAYLSGSLAVAGGKRWRSWMLLDRDNPLSKDGAQHVDTTHFIPAAGQPDVPGVDRVVHAGGLYAVYETPSAKMPRQLCALAEQIRDSLDCDMIEGAFGGRIMLREITVSGYTAARERRVALYIPVRSRGIFLPTIPSSYRDTRIAIKI